MSAQHTPIPWKVDPGSPDQIAFGFSTVAKSEMTYGASVAFANSRFIVVAVNHHAALVAALEKMTTWAATYAKQSGIDWRTGTGPLSVDVREAKELLAKSTTP